MIPQRGDVVRIDRNCGLQFRFCDPFLFLVSTAATPAHSPDGSVWLKGVEVDGHGQPVPGGHREIWVPNADALTVAPPAPVNGLRLHADGLRRYTTNAGPLVPRQRQGGRPVKTAHANRGAR